MEFKKVKKLNMPHAAQRPSFAHANSTTTLGSDFIWGVFVAAKKTKKTPQSSQPVTLMLNSTPTVQECRTHAGWLVVNHCFQVIHFLSPCKTNVQIFKTSATTAVLSRVSEFTARETTCTAVRTPVEAGTGSGDGAMVQNAALGFFELTVWSEVWFTAGMFLSCWFNRTHEHLWTWQVLHVCETARY